jgi:hypothetical protein
MSLLQFYSYNDGCLHVSGPQVHPQEISSSCSHNHWFSFCTVLVACSEKMHGTKSFDNLLVIYSKFSCGTRNRFARETMVFAVYWLGNISKGYALLLGHTGLILFMSPNPSPICFCFFAVALLPNAGHDFLILEVFLDHTQRRTTVGRTPLDEWSSRHRDLYLTTHNTHSRQTSRPPGGFKPTFSACEQPQTYALDGAATGTGKPHMILYY